MIDSLALGWSWTGGCAGVADALAAAGEGDTSGDVSAPALEGKGVLGVAFRGVLAAALEAGLEGPAALGGADWHSNCSSATVALSLASRRACSKQASRGLRGACAQAARGVSSNKATR